MEYRSCADDGHRQGHDRTEPSTTEPRVSAAANELIRQAAVVSGQSVTRYVTDVALHRARQVLADQVHVAVDQQVVGPRPGRAGRAAPVQSAVGQAVRASVSRRGVGDEQRNDWMRRHAGQNTDDRNAVSSCCTRDGGIFGYYQKGARDRVGQISAAGAERDSTPHHAGRGSADSLAAAARPWQRAADEVA